MGERTDIAGLIERLERMATDCAAAANERGLRIESQYHAMGAASAHKKSALLLKALLRTLETEQ